MFQWLIENLATIVISLILLAAVVLIVVRMMKNRKQGKSSCGCGCSNCPMSASCHGRDDKGQKSR